MPKRVAKKVPAETKRLKITLRKSTIGFGKKQAAIVQGLGLRKPNSSVELLDTPATRGMILKVRHLIEVQ